MPPHSEFLSYALLLLVVVALAIMFTVMYKITDRTQSELRRLNPSGSTDSIINPRTKILIAFWLLLAMLLIFF